MALRLSTCSPSMPLQTPSHSHIAHRSVTHRLHDTPSPPTLLRALNLRCLNSRRRHNHAASPACNVPVRPCVTLDALVCGDVVPVYMYLTIDAVGEDKPMQYNHNPLAGLFSVGVQIVFNFFILEVFTGVIIDNFTRAKHNKKVCRARRATPSVSWSRAHSLVVQCHVPVGSLTCRWCAVTRVRRRGRRC